MNEVSGVTGPSPNRIETGPTEAAAQVPASPPIDTGRVEHTGAPSPSVPPLPPGPGSIDHALAGSATQVISENVGTDFGHIAALMMMIDSELARAARDSQVAQIESVADQMHASADDIRESAKLALAGGVVAGATQIASAGISVGGGIKGMSLTSSAASSEAAAVAAEPKLTAPEEPAPSTARGAAGAEGPAASLPEDVELPGTGRAGAAESETQQVRQETTEENVKDVSSSKQKMAARRLDHTLSQQLSARSQNVALVTEGLSKLTSSTGEMIKSALEYESRQKDADSKEAEARAEEQRAYLDRTKGFADAMQKGAQDMLQIFQQMDESVHQTNKAVWSRA